MNLPVSAIMSGVLLWTSLSSAADRVVRARTPINIPDVPGLLTLKCDFHTHTVFSDGRVWPDVRAEEAWREGLDAVAITDHIEYQPHKADITTNHNRSYEIAREAANALDVILIKGSEITRQMPPGHLNAIFLTNSAALVATNWRDAIRAAHDQGAFITWNHPGWENQITNNQVVWYPEHTWLLEQGWLQGIEVVNERDYYPDAHRWAVEKKLTMLGNSDIHAPLNLDFHVHDGDHRPMTLVFATARSADAIKDALLARRTAVYSGRQLIGDDQFLRPIFQKSVRFNRTSLTLRGTSAVYLQLSNESDLLYELDQVAEPDTVRAPKNLIVPPRKTVLFELRARPGAPGGVTPLVLNYTVQNLLVGPDQPLPVQFPFQVTFTATEKR